MAPGLRSSSDRPVTALWPLGTAGWEAPTGKAVATEYAWSLALCTESWPSRSVHGPWHGLAAWLAVKGLEERGRV